MDCQNYCLFLSIHIRDAGVLTSCIQIFRIAIFLPSHLLFNYQLSNFAVGSMCSVRVTPSYVRKCNNVQLMQLKQGKDSKIGNSGAFNRHLYFVGIEIYKSLDCDVRCVTLRKSLVRILKLYPNLYWCNINDH